MLHIWRPFPTGVSLACVMLRWHGAHLTRRSVQLFQQSEGVFNVVKAHLNILRALYLTGERTRYSDWLRTGQRRGRTSSHCRVKNFLFSAPSRPVLGPTHPPIKWVLEALSPGAKRAGREADHSPPTVAEVKNTWTYTSTSPYVFTGTTYLTLYLTFHCTCESYEYHNNINRCEIYKLRGHEPPSICHIPALHLSGVRHRSCIHFAQVLLLFNVLKQSAFCPQSVE
jgi:hypothetical protein